MNLKSKTLVTCLVFLSTAVTFAAPKIGEPAPEFELKDSQGKTHKLSSYKGKFVVLEWFNHECPYVVKHYTQGAKYDSVNMQSTQKKLKDQGVIWLSINSTNSKHKDYKTPEQTNDLIKKNNSKAHAVLIDSESAVGKKYEAQTTPHMFVINPEGKIVYMGAIDDNSSSKPEKLIGAKNHVLTAFEKAKNKQPIDVAVTKPYGCGVKYPN